jgi:hypothetical protein
VHSSLQFFFFLSIFCVHLFFVVMACRAQARKHRQKMYFTKPLTYTIYFSELFFLRQDVAISCYTKLFFHFKIAPKMHKMALVAFNAYVCTCFDSNIAMTGSFIFSFSFSLFLHYIHLSMHFFMSTT